MTQGEKVKELINIIEGALEDEDIKPSSRAEMEKDLLNLNAVLDIINEEKVCTATDDSLCRNIDDDKINPKHYPQDSIKFMRKCSTSEQFKGYCKLTAMKYLIRLDHKDEPIINAKKSKWFLEKLIEEMEG